MASHVPLILHQIIKGSNVFFSSFLHVPVKFETDSFMKYINTRTCGFDRKKDKYYYFIFIQNYTNCITIC